MGVNFHFRAPELSDSRGKTLSSCLNLALLLENSDCGLNFTNLSHKKIGFSFLLVRGKRLSRLKGAPFGYFWYYEVDKRFLENCPRGYLEDAFWRAVFSRSRLACSSFFPKFTNELTKKFTKVLHLSTMI